jgi:carboxymethylenebutenolidase
MRWHGRSVRWLATANRYIADRIYVDAFIRDELSKGRYDPAISKVCFEMLLELFSRTLKVDVGERSGGKQKIEDVC